VNFVHADSTDQTNSLPQNVLSGTDVSFTFSTEPRLPISILPDDLEEKRKQVIKIVLDRFPYLSLHGSFRTSYYFTFNRFTYCPICLKEHEKKCITGTWGSGKYCGKQTYRLKCNEEYQKVIPIVSVKA